MSRIRRATRQELLNGCREGATLWVDNGVRPRRRAFTLIELLVVIVVIAVLAGRVAPSVFQHVGAAKDATTRSQLEMLGAALDAHLLDKWPASTGWVIQAGTSPMPPSVASQTTIATATATAPSAPLTSTT
jgi:prepilin-type N-terminal cleavage/methylation domain-containing protein